MALILFITIFTNVSNTSHFANASSTQNNASKSCDFTDVDKERTNNGNASVHSSPEAHSFSQPNAIAYDCKNGNFYVVNQDSNSVSVINSKNYRVIKNITLGDSTSGLMSIVYNSANNKVYLTNSGGSIVSVINPRNNTLMQTIPIPHEMNPSGYGLAFNPINGKVYEIRGNDIIRRVDPITGNYWHEHRDPVLNVINGKTGSIIKSITIKGSDYPLGVAFDSWNQNIYVNAGGRILVIDSLNYKTVKTINVSCCIGGLEFNPKNGYVYGIGRSSVDVIDGTTKEIISTISLPASTMTIDPSSGDVYVAGKSHTYDTSSVVSIINGTTNEVRKSISFAANADALAFDPRRGDLYVADKDANVVNVIQGGILNPYTIKTIY